MHARSDDDARPFVTKPSGYWGWYVRNPRGYVSAELSLHSRVALARENVVRTSQGWDKYMVKEKLS